MKYTRLATLFCIMLFFTPVFSQVVNASVISIENKTINDIEIGLPEDSYYSGVKDLSLNSTDNFNNFVLTDMDKRFGDTGKYICPITPPAVYEYPDNLSYVSAASIFSLGKEIFSGAATIWFRFPFAPSNNYSYDELNLTVKVFKIDNINNNITNISLRNIVFDTPGANLIGQGFYNTSFGGSDPPGFKRQTETVLGYNLTFLWGRVAVPVSTVGEYAVLYGASYKQYLPGANSIKFDFYMSSGDSFADDRYRSWIRPYNNDSLYLPFDLDMSLLVSEINSYGLHSQGVGAGYHVRSFIPIDNVTVDINTRVNFFVPVFVDTDSLRYNLSIRATDSTLYWWNQTTGLYTGETYLSYSHNPPVAWNTKTIDMVSLEISTVNNSKFRVFATDNPYKTWLLYQRLWPLQITQAGLPDNGGLLRSVPEANFNSTHMLYGYISADPFELLQTRLTPVIVPFWSMPSHSDTIEVLTQFRIEISKRNEEVLTSNSYNRIISRVVEDTLKFVFDLNAPFFLAVDSQYYVINKLLDFWLSAEDNNSRFSNIPGIGDIYDFMQDIKGGLKTSLGFIINIAEAAMDYTIYLLVMVSKFLGVLLAIILSMLILEGANAGFKGLTNGNLIQELGQLWPDTFRILTLIWMVVYGILQFIMSLVQEVLPL